MDNFEQYIQSLVQYAGDAIFAVGKTQCILSWNLGAEELLGYKSDEVLGKSVDMLSPHENRRQMRSMVVEVMEGGALKNLECQLITKSGQIIAAYVTASPIQDELSEVVGVSIIAKDVTDQNRLLNMLIEKEKRSAHLEGLIESLTTISHHIRNAAAVISTRAELARQLDEIATYHNLSEICVKETRRIAAVIDSLNDIVREVKKTDHDFKTVEMRGAPSKMIDIEASIKEKLRRIDEEFR